MEKEKSKIFAVDFFDDELWKNIVDTAKMSSVHNTKFLCNVFFCHGCGGNNIKTYLFTEHQWRILLDTISDDQKTELMKYIETQWATCRATPVGSATGGGVALVYVTNLDENDDFKVIKLKARNCTGNIFERRKVPDKDLWFYIDNKLMTKAYEANGRIPTKKGKNKKFESKLIGIMTEWLYYFGKNKGDTGKHVVYCPDISNPCPERYTYLPQELLR